MPISEFDRQVNNLLEKGYPKLAGLKEDDFLQHIDPLKTIIRETETRGNVRKEGHIPFVIVVKSDLIAREEAIQLVGSNGKNGFSVLEEDDIKGFQAIEGLQIPKGLAYLLLDIETGKDTLNVTPNEAIEIIKKVNRSPLTIDEGIALVTHYPEVLKKNNGFSLLGSRCGDRRVTALWISKGQPKLGWCWAANPHTWLGSASCGGRVGI